MSSVAKRRAITFQNIEHIIQDNHPNLPLDVLLALDRMVVEVSMQLYNVGSRERSSMRRHTRQLHAKVREHLPRVRKSPVKP